MENAVAAGLADFELLPATRDRSLRSVKNYNRDLTQKFIRAYRNLPLLWDPSSKDYMIKWRRKKAYEELLVVYKDMKENATVDDVKKKINSLRTNYRKELKKWINGDYTPSCWTFEELSFLSGQIQDPPAKISELSSVSLDLKETDFKEEVIEEDLEENFSADFIVAERNREYVTIPANGQVPPNLIVPTSFADPASEPGSKRRKETHSCYQNRPQSVVSSHAQEYDDSIEDVIAKGWALKLKRMTREQRIFSEKFINDVLLEGELGTLHRHSVRINEIAFNMVPVHPPP